MELLEQRVLGQGCICAPQPVGTASGLSRCLCFLSAKKCEVRRMETFSAFRRMEVRMLMAEEIEAAFSCLGLSCAQHYVQITRERA